MSTRVSIEADKTINVPRQILEKRNRFLHMKENHPLSIIKNLIYKFFGDEFEKFDELDSVVSTKDNFDLLLIKEDHPSRSRSDTYYVDENTVLRTQTSAHQNELLKRGKSKFLVTGDVFRKDEINRTHYPVFHQMEGVCVLEYDDEKRCEEELKKVLSKLIEHLFPKCKYKFKSDYFPFTNPSYEVEVEFNGKDLEILGCGVVQPAILKNCNITNKSAWAFGLGLERLAMILFNIPDIRYFWTNDERFLDQFKEGKIVEFKPYSNLENVQQDIAFWISVDQYKNDKWIAENDFYDIVRKHADEHVEKVELFDVYKNKQGTKISHAYHINYSPNNTSFKNPAEFRVFTLKVYEEIRKEVNEKLMVTLR